MAGLVGVLKNGGGLGTGESVSLILSCIDLPVSHVSDVDFAALTGNPVNHAISFIRINR